MSGNRYAVDRKIHDMVTGQAKATLAELRRLNRKSRHVADDETWLVEDGDGVHVITAKEVRIRNAKHVDFMRKARL